MKDSDISKSVFWLMLSVIAAGSMFFYVEVIWGHGQPPGFSDLYARWWGAHELLLHHRDPYSAEVSHEIQTVIYGAPMSPGTPDDPAGIGGGFAYPIYVVLLLWPTIHLSFPTVQKIFFAVGLAGTLASLAAWLHLLKFRSSLLLWITIAIFALGSFPALQAFKLQNPSLIAAAFISIAIFLLSAGRLGWAGFLFAISTFKPQFMVALVPWLAIWTLADWGRRKTLAASFVLTALGLAAFSQWLLPGWVLEFLRIAHAYRQYAYGHSLLDVWFTPAFGAPASACLMAAMLAFCWHDRSQPSNSPNFLVATSLLLAANVLITPTLAPHGQLLLLPGILALIRYRESLWKSTAGRLTLLCACALLAWPWLASVTLAVAAIHYPAITLLRFWQLPLYPSPVFPLAVLLVLASLLRSISRTPNRTSP